MAKRGNKLAKKAKKKGLSHAKITNIRKYKMAKRGEMTEAQRKKKKQEKKAQKKVTYAELHDRKKQAKERKEKFDAEEELYPLTAEVSGEDMMKMIDPDDLTYLVEKKGTKRKNQGNEEEGKEDYESEVRTFDEMHDGKKVKGLLPYKTDQGIIPRFRKVEDEEAEKTEDKENKEEAEEEDGEDEKEEGEEEEEGKENVPEEKSAIEFLIERQKKLEEKKIKIGCLAANFIQQPEERLSGFSSLLHFMDETDPDIALTIKKYTALSLLEVFNKVIPQYPIQRHDINQKLKKETQQVYFYENHLLSGYQIYLKALENMLSDCSKKTKVPAMQSLGLVAVKCFGELLNTHSHFNYTSNIIQALVPLLNHPHDPLSSLTASYLTRMFKIDKMGYHSYEIVKRIDHFVRRRSFRVRPEVLGVLLGLRMKEATSLDTIIESKLNCKRKMTHTEKLLRRVTEEQKKKSKKEARLFRKKRKLEEQMKGIKEEKMSEARKKQHTGLIQLVFGLYIHVLKRRPNNKLNAVVLEGLAKFSHLINIEFFADLLNVLGGLMSEGSLKFRESLHCIQVVFTILAGQGEVLTLDPHRFFTYLYANMFRLSAGMNHDDIQSVVESLKQMLVEHKRKANPGRVLAFSKRLSTLSLALLHHGTIPALTTLRSIVLNHPSVETLMETDSEGTSGVFSAEVEEPEHSNAGASTFWEFHLLSRHYHSTVQQLATHLLAGAPLQGDKTLPYTLTKRSIHELFEEYNPSEMRFKPPVPPPGQHLTNQICHRTKKRKRGNREHYFTDYMSSQIETLKASPPPLVNGHTEGAVNGVPQVNGLAEFPCVSVQDVDFSKGMLANMDLKRIKVREREEEDASKAVTVCLLKVETKA